MGAIKWQIVVLNRSYFRMNALSTNGSSHAYCMAFEKPYKFDFFIDHITSSNASFAILGTSSDKS